LEQLRRGGVDHDTNGVAKVGLLVVGGNVAVEEHFVGEAAASAGAHSDAQGKIFGAFSVEQFADLGGGGVGECDHGVPPGGCGC